MDGSRFRRPSFPVTLPVLVVVLAGWRDSSNAMKPGRGSCCPDPLLALFAPHDVTWLTFGLIYIGLIAAIVYLLRHPATLLVAMQAYVADGGIPDHCHDARTARAAADHAPVERSARGGLRHRASAHERSVLLRAHVDARSCSSLSRPGRTEAGFPGVYRCCGLLRACAARALQYRCLCCTIRCVRRRTFGLCAPYTYTGCPTSRHS